MTTPPAFEDWIRLIVTFLWKVINPHWQFFVGGLIAIILLIILWRFFGMR